MTNQPEPLSLTERQQTILRMLRDAPGLTTPMLAKAINVRLVITNRVLDRLVQLGLVIGVPTLTGANGRPPTLWRLRNSAASYVGLPALGSHHYRKPPADLQREREGERELERQVLQCAGWALIKPQRPAPQQTPTPQCKRLRDDLVAYTGGAWSPTLVGLVPPGCNDFVAYREDSAVSALLIVHPARATYSHWSRPPSPANSHAEQPTRPGRIILYGPLAEEFPDHIAAVFPDEDTADPYVDRIEGAGLMVLVLNNETEIAKFLTALEER